ncbi:hypothetical protein C5167_021273 [Papaver somniferum]|uniref:Uncharacterized protein n=1 Tax=Papaver somniferum TaxID=3469 RepID=A0A4Y7IYM5_PAPSO|nr:hypothetical protein C5167_021273 [Papaver somniferum]
MAFSCLMFTVQRLQPELIAPAKPTPYEMKHLSDIDDRKGLRFHVPTILFYRKKDLRVGSTCKTDDIVGVMKKALAATLVFYYPYLLVGLEKFPEADADVSLEQLGGDFLKPPFLCLEQLLYSPSNSEDILNSPMLFIQVTRLTCGGFIFGLRYNHTICDGQGIHQFMKALVEMARGEISPSILPVWERHLLNARDPPQVMFAHREEKLPSLDDMVQHSFFFVPKELAAHIAPHLQACTNFDLLTAWLWRCRIIARGKFHSPLPTGFYGNAVAYPVAVSTTEKLIQNPSSF